jgi:hypothetical protein
LAIVGFLLFVWDLGLDDRAGVLRYVLGAVLRPCIGAADGYGRHGLLVFGHGPS